MTSRATDRERRMVAEKLRRQAEFWHETLDNGEELPEAWATIDMAGVPFIIRAALHSCGMGDVVYIPYIFSRLSDLIGPDEPEGMVSLPKDFDGNTVHVGSRLRPVDGARDHIDCVYVAGITLYADGWRFRSVDGWEDRTDRYWVIGER